MKIKFTPNLNFSLHKGMMLLLFYLDYLFPKHPWHGKQINTPSQVQTQKLTTHAPLNSKETMDRVPAVVMAR